MGSFKSIVAAGAASAKGRHNTSVSKAGKGYTLQIATRDILGDVVSLRRGRGDGDTERLFVAKLVEQRRSMAPDSAFLLQSSQDANVLGFAKPWVGVCHPQFHLPREATALLLHP